MRDRLIEWICNIKCKGEDFRNGGCAFRKDERCIKIDNLDMCMIGCIADNILANGAIVPPCKVGDMVYYLTTVVTKKELNVSEIFDGVVQTIGFDGKYIWISVRYTNGLFYCHYEKDLGKNVFLTREEAEKALEERSGE